ncbi:DNA mismatch endonuclease Vsr [Mameliella sp. CS4]|uniref:very short patch repair endonuclease n=1 Tax=Mameliella sp. CS4 TaxID=2862329 RepID=UPI001C5D9CA4|nr:DNA mismatch endonuclease Vsr [Mameliella sp. CS4]
MADIVDSATRSRMMRGIRGKDTKPEVRLRSALHRRGFRFRKNVRSLPGSPDIVLRRYRALIFLHGCFWHGHDCALFRLPGTRTDFWRAKIEANRERDVRVKAALAQTSWRVLTVWECAAKGPERIGFDEVESRTVNWLTGGAGSAEIRGETHGAG